MQGGLSVCLARRIALNGATVGHVILAYCFHLNEHGYCRTHRSAAQEEATADALLAALERSVRLRRAAGNEPTMDHR